MFFENKNNLDILRNAIQFLDQYNFENDSIESQVEKILSIINSIASSSSEWDKKCNFNINSVGDSYIDYLVKTNSNNITDEIVNNLYVLSYRFLLEYNFSSDNGLSVRFKNILANIEEDIKSEDINPTLKSELVYAAYIMPSRIIQSIMQSDKINDFKEFSKTHQRAISEQASWKKYIDEQREKVEKLKDTLKKYEDSYNFTGLYDGFNDLRKSKITEKRYSVFFLFSLAILIIIIPVLEVCYIYDNKGEISELKDSIMLSFFPVATIEILLIYFFRVFLHNFKSIKSQLLQIDLRRTLCQFIQSYTEYSADVKEKGDTSLEKFENIIFSGIVASDDDLPSTYDGINQLTNILNKINKK